MSEPMCGCGGCGDSHNGCSGCADSRSGCGGCADSHSGCCHASPLPIPTPAQKKFLVELALQEKLPVARFLITSDQTDDICILALAPVYIQSPNDDMQTVKAFGQFLQELEDAGFIELEYGVPLADYPYLEYTSSTLYVFFEQTVRDGAQNASYLGNTAFLERGSISLTSLGTRVLAAD